MHDYQRDGVRFLHDHPRCLLLDAPGVGKTIQVLGLIHRLRAEGALGRVLIAVDSQMCARQLPDLPVFDAADKKQRESWQSERRAGLI